MKECDDSYNEESIAKDAVEKVVLGKMPISPSDNKPAKFKCDVSGDNCQNTIIREGNVANILAIRKENGENNWNVEKIACSDCSLEEYFDAEKIDGVAAVVLAGLLEPVQQKNREPVRLDNPTIWDVKMTHSQNS